jgi:hypothetical protein
MLSEPREALPRSSTYAVAAGQPGRLDLTTVYQGDPTRLHTTGIYSVGGDVLRYSVAPPGRPRPADFTTAAGDGRTVVELRRAAPIARGPDHRTIQTHRPGEG